MLPGPKDISIETHNRNSHISLKASVRSSSSVLFIAYRLKPNFTIAFISLYSLLLHRIIYWSLALLSICWLFHETTKQETSLKWVCLSPSLQFSPHCVFFSRLLQKGPVGNCIFFSRVLFSLCASAHCKNHSVWFKELS